MQFLFCRKTYLFKLRMGIGLFWAVFFGLFCALGVWQLHRYDYKKNLLATYQQRLASLPKPFQADSQQFQTIVVTGRYLNQLTMLVQNRFYKDQPGFEVLTAFKIPHDEKLLLIDRGWISSQFREKGNLSTHSPVHGNDVVVGYVKFLNEYQFILGENILYPNASPIVMQKIDTKKLSEITHQAFYPFILRLSANQPNGFVRDWTITTVLPERHMGYAVQWFAMAFVLLIAYFCFCCERVKPNDER